MWICWPVIKGHSRTTSSNTYLTFDNSDLFYILIRYSSSEYNGAFRPRDLESFVNIRLPFNGSINTKIYSSCSHLRWDFSFNSDNLKSQCSGRYKGFRVIVQDGTSFFEV